jgi:hypothetical protein
LSGIETKVVTLAWERGQFMGLGRGILHEMGTDGWLPVAGDYNFDDRELSILFQRDADMTTSWEVTAHPSKGAGAYALQGAQQRLTELNSAGGLFSANPCKLAAVIDGAAYPGESMILVAQKILT